MAGVSLSAKTFTPKQGQYLAYIHLYTRLHRRPPAEADIQQYFRVTPPSVHQMVLTLERAGFIRRQPGAARSIEVLVDPNFCQSCCDMRIQHVIITVTRY
jgi:DNA-binding MarR family transcriptional regulator